MSDQDQDRRAVERLLDSTNSSLQHFEKEHIRLQGRIMFLEARLAQVEQGATFSEHVIHEHIEKVNRQSQEYLEENMALKAENRELKKELVILKGD